MDRTKYILYICAIIAFVAILFMIFGCFYMNGKIEEFQNSSNIDVKNLKIPKESKALLKMLMSSKTSDDEILKYMNKNKEFFKNPTQIDNMYKYINDLIKKRSKK